MKLLDGKKLQKELLLALKEKYDKLDRKLTLVVFLVGNKEESLSYIKQKEKVASYLGCHFVLKAFDSIDEESLLKQITLANEDPLVDGILVQLPLPNLLNKERILNQVVPYKDVDGLNVISRKNFLTEKYSFIPCTPKGIMDLLKHYSISLKNKEIAILGRSILVGSPLKILMEREGGHIHLIHSKTKNKNRILKNCDIVVCAVGKPEFLKGDMLKQGVILVDVGTNYVNKKLVGDVDISSVLDKCSYLTPVPGGVGPMTVYELFSNLYEAYNKRL